MKVWSYMTIMLTMMVFLFFLGFAPTGQTAEVLNDTGIVINATTSELEQGDISSSAWYTKVFNENDGYLMALIGMAVIFVGYWTRNLEWKLVVLPFFTVFVIKFLSFGWSIVQLAESTGQSWLTAIIATIFLPITAMFIYSIVEWFGGTP